MVYSSRAIGKIEETWLLHTGSLKIMYMDHASGVDGPKTEPRELGTKQHPIENIVQGTWAEVTYNGW